METERNQMAERILDLTLEIIYLLTGEDNIYVKKTQGTGQNPILHPLHSILIPERNNEQKILEVTKKIIDLLNDESGNWSNLNIHIKKEIKEEDDEEWEYLEGHKDLHEDVMMDHQHPLTSSDGSSNGNPPERCSSPLYSRDSSSEDHITPDQDQWVEVFDIKTEVKEEVEEEEEMHVKGNQLSIKDSEIMVTITKEESSPDGRTGGHNGWSNPAGRVILSAERKKEDTSSAQHSPVAGIVTPNIVPKPNHVVRSADPQTGIILWNPNINHILVPQVSNQAFIVQINPSNPDLGVQQRKNTNDKPFSCSECQKSFTNKSHLIQHQRVHTGEKPFSCSECGKCFSNRGNRDKHVRVHTGERPFSCTECGKRFAQKVTLIIHQKTHARRMIYSRTHTL